MSVEGLLSQFIAPMKEDLAKLDGDTGGATRAGDAFGRAQTAISELGSKHSSASTAVLNSWSGDKANAFTSRVATFSSAATLLSSNASAIKTAASTGVTSVTGGRTAIQGLIDEFTSKATPKLAAALAASLLAGPGVVLAALADLAGMASGYQSKTSAELQKVRDQLTQLVGQLNALQKPDAGALGKLGEPLGGDEGTTSASSATDTPAQQQESGPGSNSGSGSGSGGGGGGGGGGSGSGGGGGGGGGGGSGPRLPVAIPPQPGEGVGVNLPDGSSAEAPNETAAKAVRNALSALGTPYVWGGANPPQGTDCSGLTQWAYGGAGFDIPRPASSQAMGASVPPDQVLPGDLVVWDGHVAMVIGNGQMVEAGDPVQVQPIRTTNSGMSFYGFYRPTG
ncbi:C40 family peptidase [Lentzea sp. HUAS12]|uniref:C40 family peptidase n=1 Tax=Lentzea sp. HUAS12 TaxID=2951806 RepID=UPI0020A1DBF7|nr:C40 family peptidase [Lentzea sp. HUAS12]USX50866.1 C40 family peptidase [Lentzea sp. HUAS12]